jgi:hypothetical protein
MLAHASVAVARFRAVSFYGQLETGEMVSVFDANNNGGVGGGGRYVAPVGLVGANVTTEQRYSAVRFRFGHPYWLSHLTDGESSVVADDNSTISVEASPDGNWLVYESAEPVTLREMEIRAVSSCLAFAQVALRPDLDVETRDTQVRVDSDSAWLTLIGPAFSKEPVETAQVNTLLPTTELTVARFAKWIEINDRFDGLAWAVARRMDVAIQVQVQLLTSLVEGFHRRLPETFEQTVFPDATSAALRRIRKAAVAAAGDKAAQEGLDSTLMQERVRRAVGHLGDVSYRERAAAVVARVCAEIPEIASMVPHLDAHLTDPRHSFAHQLPQDGIKDPLDDRATRWIVISRVTPWLLRALLLLEVGVEPQLLHQKYLENENFAFDRVNVELRVRQLGWEPRSGGTAVKSATDQPQSQVDASVGVGDWVLILTYNITAPEEVTRAWEGEFAGLRLAVERIPQRGLEITANAAGDRSMTEVIVSVRDQIDAVIGHEPVAMNVFRQA